ncbi:MULTISPECIES: cytochrome c biogenesis CcdA family protein [Bacteria]
MSLELFALSSLALVAGVVSFTAPCTLPLLPGYISYVSGMASSGAVVAKSKVLAGAGLFVLGFSVVFVALGLTASGLGLLLAQNGRLLELAGGAFIVIMGLVTAGALRIPLLQRQLSFDLSKLGRGPRSAAPLGAAFAFGWTPCIGPVLASVLVTAASTESMFEGAVLLAAYSLGLGLPFLGLAVAVARGNARIGWLRRHTRKLEVAGGVVLVLMGLAVMSGLWTEWMSSMLSWYAKVGWPPI